MMGICRVKFNRPTECNCCIVNYSKRICVKTFFRVIVVPNLELCCKDLSWRLIFVTARRMSRDVNSDICFSTDETNYVLLP